MRIEILNFQNDILRSVEKREENKQSSEAKDTSCRRHKSSLKFVHSGLLQWISAVCKIYRESQSVTPIVNLTI